MTMRIRVPPNIKAGQIITVQLLIQHSMESGYRLDENGKTIPKNPIRELVGRYNGAEVLRSRLSPGIAANPYLEFDMVARESGELEISWRDDSGKSESTKERITVG